VDVEIFGVPVQVNGSQIGVLALYNDISERVQAEKALRESKDKLRFLASHDPLTHLPNRFLFDERLAHALSWAKRASQQVAILFMDLDGFKSVNDTFGHSKGDQLLQEAAERLQDCMRESDTVARSGGDEFTIILENVAQAEDVVLVAKKIIACFQEPFFVDGNSTRITTSIGISLYPQDGEDGEILLKNADKAMYNAKSRGKDGFTFYSTNRR
jgi:diguanylate cyclase (GGDEF)-like protein